MTAVPPRPRAIRYPFAIDRGVGRLKEEPDHARHVEQLMLQVLLTAPGERINRPDFGCGVRRMLFAPVTEVAATLAQSTIYQALERWLAGLIRVEEVRVRAATERFEITVVYALLTRPGRRYLNLEVAP